MEFEQGNQTTNVVGTSIMASANAALSAAGVPSTFNYTTISSQNLNGEHMGLGYTLGGAYQFNDMWSVSLGVRYVKSEREMDGNITVSPTTAFPTAGVNDSRTALVSFEEEADGFGGVIGVNISPNDQWNIGIHYDTEVELDYEQTVIQDNFGILPNLGVVHNGERERNLPAVLGTGVSYQVNPKFRVETNLTYYFNEDADFKDIAGTSRDESAVDNGYDIGIGCEYAWTDTISTTLGYLYTETGVDAKDMTPELPELDAHTFGTGLKYKMNEKTSFIISAGHVFYDDASFVSSSTGASVTYEKEITFIGFGVQYKFF